MTACVDSVVPLAETARLAFGAAEVCQPLSNLFGACGADEQVRHMRALAGQMLTEAMWCWSPTAPHLGADRVAGSR